MPLDSDNEPACHVFDGLNDTIGSFRRNAQVAARTLNTLVMKAVDLHIQGSSIACWARKSREQTAAFQLDGMSGFVMCKSIGNHGRNVLNQAPASEYIETLNSKTNTQDWQIRGFRMLHERKIRRVAFRIQLAELWMRLGTVELRINIGRTARQQNSVCLFQIIVND